MLFYGYKKCSTSQKAEKWLQNHGIEYTFHDIKTENPTFAQLQDWLGKSELDVKRFFNTSGMRYRELELKDKLPQMSEKEKLELLSTDGMLVKRPVLVGDDFVLVGFREAQWAQKLL